MPVLGLIFELREQTLKITAFGIGSVGLVTGACLADGGHEVMCVDVDQKKIDSLRPGIVPIFEPGLEGLVKQKQATGRLRVTSDAGTAEAFGGLQFITVGTATAEDEDGRAHD